MVYGALIVTGIQIMISDANAAISNLAVYLAASSRVVPALARIQNSFISINHNLASCSMTLDLIEEIEGYFDNKKQSVSDQIRPRNHFIPSIDFQNVSFKYPDSDCNALSNISFRINQGSFVAIIGESGAGKSTLAKLILGNLTPTNGSVRVSNCPADKVAQTWPGAVAYLPQKVIALDSNILQNVSFEKDSNSDQIETIRFLLKEVELEEFNSSSSLTKIIGEFGNSLSGGQLQRLGIARALFSQPSLIVLDEPTSAMDPITERIVLDRILARESCTKVVVAHRLATISKADLVIVLNQGRIEVVDTYEVVQKTHSLLLKGIQNQ
jgi:ATP-binding cassette subfamily C protein